MDYPEDRDSLTAFSDGFLPMFRLLAVPADASKTDMMH
jgi:hypothetical protein